MDNVDLSVLKQVIGWRSAGHRAVLGTVVRTWGSAPRPVGSLVAVRDDGQIAGSVSGGCIEDDLIDKVRQGAPRRAAGVVRYGVSGEEAARFGLPCGGTLELVLEPLPRRAPGEELLELLAARRARAPRAARPGQRRGGAAPAGRRRAVLTSMRSPPCTARAGG